MLVTCVFQYIRRCASSDRTVLSISNLDVVCMARCEQSQYHCSQTNAVISLIFRILITSGRQDHQYSLPYKRYSYTFSCLVGNALHKVNNNNLLLLRSGRTRNARTMLTTYAANCMLLRRLFVGHLGELWPQGWTDRHTTWHGVSLNQGGGVRSPKLWF